MKIRRWVGANVSHGFGLVNPNERVANALPSSNSINVVQHSVEKGVGHGWVAGLVGKELLDE